MWAEIHNYLQRSEHTTLIRSIKYQFDYEQLYQQVVNGTACSDKEKSDFIESVLKAYDALDGAICDYHHRYSRNPIIDLNSVDKLISRMIGNAGERKRVFFFTLNQDIFIERYFRSIAEYKPVLPGINFKYERPLNLSDKILDFNDFATVQGQLELGKHKNDLKSLGLLYYVKLHGSFDWRDTQNQSKLVIGVNKSEQIEVEPILAWYFQLFKEALSCPERHLIIGYGFRDPHINEVIVESIRNSKLKIFIICPQDPHDFLTSTLKSVEGRDTIWHAVAGYYPYTLENFFPSDCFPSRHYNNLVNDFIES